MKRWKFVQLLLRMISTLYCSQRKRKITTEFVWWTLHLDATFCWFFTVKLKLACQLEFFLSLRDNASTPNLLSYLQNVCSHNRDSNLRTSMDVRRNSLTFNQMATVERQEFTGSYFHGTLQARWLKPRIIPSVAETFCPYNYLVLLLMKWEFGAWLHC